MTFEPDATYYFICFPFSIHQFTILLKHIEVDNLNLSLSARIRHSVSGTGRYCKPVFCSNNTYLYHCITISEEDKDKHCSTLRFLDKDSKISNQPRRSFSRFVCLGHLNITLEARGIPQ